MRIFGQLNTANPAGEWCRLLQPYLFLTRLKFIFDAPPVFMVYWFTATRPKAYSADLRFRKTAG